MAVEAKPMWTQNPKELVYLAVFYVVGFALLKYIRRLVTDKLCLLNLYTNYIFKE